MKITFNYKVLNSFNDFRVYLGWQLDPGPMSTRKKYLQWVG